MESISGPDMACHIWAISGVYIWAIYGISVRVYNYSSFFIVISPVTNGVITCFDKPVGLFGTVQGDAGPTLAKLGCPIRSRLSPRDQMSRAAQPGPTSSPEEAMLSGTMYHVMFSVMKTQ